MKIGEIAAGIAAAGLIGTAIGAKVLYDSVIPRQEKIRVDLDEFADMSKWEEYKKIMIPNNQWLSEQSPEEIGIKARDGIMLHGYFIPADKPTDRLLIGCHGYTSGAMMEYPSHARFFHEQGFDVLIVDMRAHGKSEGKYVGFGVLDRYDLLEWIRYAEKRFEKGRKILLHGNSMGAATVLMTSGFEEIQDCVRGIVADCAFTSPYDIFAHVMKKNYHMLPFPIMNINDVMCKKTAGYTFREYSTLDALKTNRIPVLFIHGEQDKFVPTWMSVKNYEAAVCPKKLVIVKDAGHGASYYENHKLYEAEETEFIKKYF